MIRSFSFVAYIIQHQQEHFNAYKSCPYDYRTKFEHKPNKRPMLAPQHPV
ncbi:hypothetical protein [Marinobacter nauticus]|nr:hypothetical protein [Marinobacter nauticus]